MLKPVGKSRRIFVVEDEAIVALELKDQLRSAGFEISGHATRGEQALREIPEARPDLVVMDIRLGAGMSGLDVAERLRETTRVPIIFLTAFADEELTAPAANAGIVGYLTKPYDPRVLKANIELALLRRDAERAEVRFEGVFEFAPDALVIVDASGAIVRANRMSESLFGYSKEELSRLHVDALVPEPHRVQHRALREGYRVQPVARSMGSPRARLQARRKDGVLVPVEISLSPVHSDEGDLTVAAVRDVSERVKAQGERQQLEAQVARAQRMESLGTLAGGIAHDFNNLLAVICGNVDLARTDVEPAHPVADSLDEIAAAASRAKQLVAQILNFSQQRPSKRASVPVGPLVDEVVRLLRATLPAGIELTVDGQEGTIAWCDATQIHQVLMNLGTNAWHAIEGSTGHIAVRFGLVSLGEDAGFGAGAGRYIRLQVSDDGKGMDLATQEHIFEPFFTTKDVGTGTGLGLSVSHGIVASHGGGILVDSEPGLGTTFSVFLPEASGEPVAAARPEPSIWHGTGRVLLIEDEVALARVAERMIKRLGYEVTSFSDPGAALQALRDDPQRCDVVLTDQDMPKLRGLEVARAVGALRPGLPVIMASGTRQQSGGELARANVSHTLSKPYSITEMGEVLHRALSQGSE
ncbi:MAG: response regulator [Myxococcales bacterium]|nr:response regulator [Myxococcales bacterium]